MFLSSSGWTRACKTLLTASLLARPGPVLIANADLAAPRDDGFSLEPGYFGHLLVDAGVSDVRFFGKLFAEVFDLAAQSLPDTPPGRIAMCGDTLHTDILGASAKGWQTVLVAQDGLFVGHEMHDYCQRAGLFPNWRLNQI